MGATHVTVRVINPAATERIWEGLFLVDTGATDCLVPARHLRSIGMEPYGKRIYELADGSEMEVGPLEALETGGARFEFMGERVTSNVIFADDDTEPILGLTALESVGIEVDPKNQRLKRRPAVRLKANRMRG